VTTAPTPDLRALAEAVNGWSSCNEAWPHAEHFDVAVVGGITDGEQYPVSQIEADNYGTDGESLKLARFYAAANPGAVLALLDRIAELQAERDDADRRAGAAERSAAAFHEVTQRFEQVRRRMKEQWGVHDNVSFDLVWQQALDAKQAQAELEARKPLPLNDAEIMAAQESRARIGLPCSRCESGKYRADSNAYHDFHRCDSCLHVPMWGEDGKEIGPPTCAGESS